MNVGIHREDAVTERVHEYALRYLGPDTWKRHQERFCIFPAHAPERRQCHSPELGADALQDANYLSRLEPPQPRRAENILKLRQISFRYGVP